MNLIIYCIWKFTYLVAASNFPHKFQVAQNIVSCILKWGVVHHRDRNRSNNSWYNLQGMMRWQHTSLHHKGRKQSEEWVRKRVLACEGYKHYLKPPSRN